MDIALNETNYYWHLLRNLSDNIKLQLIARLSNSLVEKQDAKPVKARAARFYGAWKDEDFPMSADDMVKEIKASRHFKNDVEELLA